MGPGLDNFSRSPIGRLISILGMWTNREWRWIVAISWLLICAVYFDRFGSGMHYMALGDTDDNMRYLQVRDWLAGQSWWDLTQHRMDPPHGANIHWSRLVDLPIAGLMLFFRLFVSDARADQLALGIAPMLPLLPLMLSLAFLARRLTEKGHAWFIAMLLPLGAEMGLSMYMPMRVDHHGWQLALTTVTLAGLVDRKWVRGGIIAGVASAASVAIGMEMFVYLAAAGALIALRWIFKEGAARRVRPYALSLGGTIALGYAAFASNANRLPMCDALSPVWTSILILAAAVLLVLTYLPLRGWPQRFGAAAVGGAIVLGFAWLSWPQCLTGAYQLSPELQQKWLIYIREAKPIYVQPVAAWAQIMAIPAAGLLCGLAGCWCVRRDAERLWAWGTVTLMVAFSIGLCFWQIRAGPAAQLLAIAPLASALWALVVWLVAGPGLWRRLVAVPGLLVLGSATAAYTLYPLLSPYWIPAKKATQTNAANAAQNKARAQADDDDDDDDDDERPRTARARRNQISQSLSSTSKPRRVANAVKAPPRPSGSASGRCRSQPALQALNEVPAATIFTMVDLGPRLIAMSHHSAIAGPYHRNEKAILDIHHAMDGTPEGFRPIAAAHGATYLLICPGFPEGTIYQQRSPKGFYARLMRGETFSFLTPVKLSYPAPLPFTLYRITPEKKAGASR
jgi:hypothetical protein